MRHVKIFNVQGKPILYQWPPAKGVESIFPRCVMIHRLLYQLNISFDIQNVGLPYLESEFDDALKRLLVQLPLLQRDKTYYKSTIEIITAICQWDELSGEQRDLAQRHYSCVEDELFKWANSSFLNTLVHLRWMKEKNYQRFIRTVYWGVPDPQDNEFQKTLSDTREKVKLYLQNFPEGCLLDVDISTLLVEHLNQLESGLTGRTFFSDKDDLPDLVDFAIFMVVQGLLAPCMEERSLLISEYPKIVNWAQRVDRLSSNRPTLDLYRESLK